MRSASVEFHIVECLESHPQGNGTAATQAYNRLVEKADKTQGFCKSELVTFVPGAVNQRPDRFFKFHSNSSMSVRAPTHTDIRGGSGWRPATATTHFVFSGTS